MPFPFFSKKDQTKKEKQHEKKPTYYPVCPNCMTPHLKPVSEFTSGWLTTPRYYCAQCHYSGTIFLEIDITLLETKTPQELRKMFLEEADEGEDEEYSDETEQDK